MRFAGIEFPEPLLSALRDDRLVVFAGAGVSMGEPANLPSFRQLANAIASGTNESLEEQETEDRFLGRLSQKGVDIYERAAQILSRNGPMFTELHRSLLRFYSSVAQVRIVTTNFDLLFEHAAEKVFDRASEVYRAPALPLGHHFNGIVHIHGVMSHPSEMVLTDADFGRAYLTEGWACRFLVDLFQHFVVLFVGYSHNDTIVSYLARALPESEMGKRFALTEENDNPQRWRILGIEPIGYPKPAGRDFSALCEGVRRLADMVRRSVIDWQYEITELAAKLPPLNGEEEDVIEDALKDATRTRFFAEAAHLPEWISWLDKRKQLDALFVDSHFEERESILAWWLSEKFAISCADVLMLLISTHGMRLHPRFWRTLGSTIAREKEIDQTTLSRWVSLLLATAPEDRDGLILMALGRRCIQQGAMASLLDIFDAMAANRLSLKRDISWPDVKDDRSSRVDLDLPLVGDYYDLNELWQDGLKPAISQICECLLRLVTRCLERYHYTLRAWQKADPKWDGTSQGRSAIEPHEQDPYPEAVDVLIDVSRDCLDWLSSNREQASVRWRDYLAGSEVPLMRRLAVHALTECTYLQSDEKLNWLFTRIDLHDVSLHHEIFRLVRLIYPEASPRCRAELVRTILAYQWPDSDPDHEVLTARNHFDWLQWLHDSDPACNLTKQALEEVLVRYPEFRPREHPDMAHWMSVNWVGPQSPWTVDELLARPAVEWLPELLSFQSTASPVPDRNGLMLSIAEATKKEFDWALELATALAETGKWDSDIWSGLIRGWSEARLSECQHKEVLNWLGKANLYWKHASAIADSLNGLVKDDGKPYAINLLGQANEIARDLWQHLDRAESLEESDGWLTYAINHPGGVLTQFWLGSLSLWRRQQDPAPRTLDNEYREAFTDIVRDRSAVGRLGRSVLASQFAFFLGADETWTRENLVPLFDVDDNPLESQAAWDGFLTWGHLNPAVAELLESAFLKAIRRVKSDPIYQRERFIEFYTAMLGFFASDPIDPWIRELFHYGTVDTRCLFTSKVERYLRDMDETQQQDWWSRWLRLYWQNRLQGVPEALEPGEVEGMLDWLPHIRAAFFPDAVELAIRMPNTPLQHCKAIYRLGKGSLAKTSPEAAAKLLIFIGKSDSPKHIWYEARVIIDTLLQVGVSSGSEKNLKELITRLGL